MFLLFLLLGLLCACVPADYPSSAQFSTPSASAPALRAHAQYLTTPGRAFYHRVQYNETIWQIAKKYNIPAETIMDLNDISAPRQIVPGQSLLVPKSQYAEGLEFPSTPGLFSWPVKGRIISQFGANVNGLSNDGLNIRTDSGEAVKASGDGEVVFADYLKGWGQTIIVQHPNHFYTVYANLKNITANKGDRVTKGEAMAQVALSSGQEPVLHFEVRRDHRPDNPLKYLN